MPPNIMIKRVKCLCLVVFRVYIATPYYASNDEKGIESVAGKTGQGIE
jgi:hypothetical protein